MTHYRKIIKATTAGFILSFLFLFTGNAVAQDGKAIFSANCASCHALNRDLTGPALAGVEDRGPWGDRKKLYAWIHNPTGFMATDAYTADLKKKFNNNVMTPFPQLSEKEIDAILDYIKTAPPPGEGKTEKEPTEKNASEGDSSLLFGILTLILAIVAFTLLQVNANLRKMADDKEGVGSKEPIPFWRNKTYIAFLTVILFLVGGYLTTKGAIGLGRSQKYQPTQPIVYSHKVHAGINQVNCLYCHGAAQDGKQATIPSVNVCMNCHLAINEYTGTAKIYDAEGNEVNGTAEIQKLYKYAGFEFGKPWDPSKAKPIEWVRLHNLPDHVYFNHSQHVKAGQVQCQTCHGEINKMDEVYQFSDLSMGWCINCHRTTNVKFKDNGFYSIYEKYHENLKNGTFDSTKGITVEQIGGTECQKCHY
ncbi:c-type cytochrome [Foetidibacter luteolus]|uniref:c-type cytochrome n=1 Tax=Foetidibacter luteolus TaxID=2608880 RepID=UPI00129A88D1|nr:c-type cytochrome [Foetidibacter luteolus]